MSTGSRSRRVPPVSPLALEAVMRTDAIFDIERTINGETAERRAPLVANLEDWIAS